MEWFASSESARKVIFPARLLLAYMCSSFILWNNIELSALQQLFCTTDYWGYIYIYIEHILTQRCLSLAILSTEISQLIIYRIEILSCKCEISIKFPIAGNEMKDFDPWSKENGQRKEVKKKGSRPGHWKVPAWALSPGIVSSQVCRPR